MKQSRICISVVLQEILICVHFFKIVFRCLISFTRIELLGLQTWIEILQMCLFTCIFQINRKLDFAKMSVTTSVAFTWQNSLHKCGGVVVPLDFFFVSKFSKEYLFTHPYSSWQAKQVSYNPVPLWLLHVW